jgi:hypothetical protein
MFDKHINTINNLSERVDMKSIVLFNDFFKYFSKVKTSRQKLKTFCINKIDNITFLNNKIMDELLVELHNTFKYKVINIQTRDNLQKYVEDINKHQKIISEKDIQIDKYISELSEYTTQSNISEQNNYTRNEPQISFYDLNPYDNQYSGSDSDASYSDSNYESN